ncbi:hypothetical protein HMPREF9554_00148 [Treponema phagedenis F0421]|nr:hypothetical protein HMPREF9554_00148 [Treponema phagedenis F0421]
MLLLPYVNRRCRDLKHAERTGILNPEKHTIHFCTKKAPSKEGAFCIMLRKCGDA